MKGRTNRRDWHLPLPLSFPYNFRSFLILHLSLSFSRFFLSFSLPYWPYEVGLGGAEVEGAGYVP